MRFERQKRYGPRQLTDRQRAAYARKLAKEKARYPLFSDHVAAEQRSIDEEARHREERSSQTEQDRRNFLADVWRRSRALYFAQPDEIRARIHDKWRTWTGPCTAVYFACMVDVQSGEQARRLARIEQEFAPTRARIRRQILAQQSSTLDL
jgi:hypothetical protein